MCSSFVDIYYNVRAETVVHENGTAHEDVSVFVDGHVRIPGHEKLQ